tara:strand:- start:189 stop:635 length:447 start_codon:yes stop_codon:yes gene_type:complete
LDINKIFGAFDSSSDYWGDDRQYMNYYSYSRSKIDENHPRYFIKMFWKLIVNHLSYGRTLVDFFSQADPSLAVSEIEYAGERMLHARAYGFIKKIDLEDEYHQKILKEESSKELKEAYELAIKFYEEEEEYEKCAFLKKQLDYIKSLP